MNPSKACALIFGFCLIICYLFMIGWTYTLVSNDQAECDMWKFDPVYFRTCETGKEMGDSFSAIFWPVYLPIRLGEITWENRIWLFVERSK